MSQSARCEMSKYNLARRLVSNIDTHQHATSAKRNLILSILKSTATKRETKNYLNKYRNQFRADDDLSSRASQRSLFVARYLAKQNPFVGIYDDDTKVAKIPLRIAVVKIRYAAVDAAYWAGIRETFKRLIALGISPVVVLDHDHELLADFKLNESSLMAQENRIMAHMGHLTDGLKLSFVRSLFTTGDNGLEINSLEELLIPLYQDFMPIIRPLVYNTASGAQQFVPSNTVLAALCRALLRSQDLLSIEKIIMVDEHGGIPSIERNQTSHVFINLSQEYADIVSELYIGFLEPRVRDLHLANLHTMNEILNMVSAITHNDDTTGIITTPHIMSLNDDQLNPIIYNVLTDRPVISSSLPSSFKRTPQLSTSILKKGVSVQVLEARDYNGRFTLRNLFRDGVVDEQRFFALIEDSFGKKLDKDTYTARIDEHLATVILVGDYDGAAIITWESCGDDTVAYLDKFAIAKRNQGLPGLADIIFKLILLSHSQELIWRSRKNNPVNKWYFERCMGSMSQPQSQWKIFYTGEIFANHKFSHSGKLQTYSHICETIAPSFS